MRTQMSKAEARDFINNKELAGVLPYLEEFSYTDIMVILNEYFCDPYFNLSALEYLLDEFIDIVEREDNENYVVTINIFKKALALVRGEEG